jgi:hypothetical protein
MTCIPVVRWHDVGPTATDTGVVSKYVELASHNNARVHGPETATAWWNCCCQVKRTSIGQAILFSRSTRLFACLFTEGLILRRATHRINLQAMRNCRRDSHEKPRQAHLEQVVLP